MKQLYMLLCCLPLFGRAQNSYTVSNRPGVTANFYTLQGAIDSVASGSTIYVFPSFADYGNININKKVLIVGTGFMLELNQLPYTTPNTEGVRISSVNFMPGSDNSYITGLQITGTTYTDRFYRVLLDHVANVTINRCQADIWPTFPSGNIVIESNNSTNCTFSQCYLHTWNIEAPTHSGGSFFSELGDGSQNLLFKNNMLDNRSSNGKFTMNYNGDPRRYGNVVFINNTINGDINSSNFCNYTYQNNFFISTNPTGGFSASGLGLNGANSFNITNVTGLFPTAGNNVMGVGTDSVFASATFGYHSFDQGWQVLPTSFAKHYASDGGEVGAFGGFQPYVLSGIVSFPNIYSLSLDPDSSKRGNVLVHIKGQATN